MTAFYIQIREFWRGQTVGGFLLFAGVIVAVLYLLYSAYVTTIGSPSERAPHL
jgi:hypothetical protein